MKKIILTIVILLFSVSIVHALLLVEYDRANNTGAVAVPSWTASHVNANTLNRGPGITYNTSSSSYNSKNWGNAFDSEDYVTFSVTPENGYYLNITQIKIRLDRSGTGPDKWVLRSNQDNYVSNLFSDDGLSEAGETYTIALTLSNISSELIFRVYAWNASSAAGTLDVEGFAGVNLAAPGIQLSGDEPTLPVTLSTFTAQYLNSKPTLYWQTQSEEDNMGWFIYRNTTENFTSAEKITGMINGHGTTTEPQSYIYEDAEQLQVEQTYYYWLESVDYSGTIHHFDMVAHITIPHPNDTGQNVIPPVAYDISADPNPFSYTTNISFVMDQPSMVDVTIYNIKGQLMKSFNSIKTTQENETVTFSWNGKDDSGKSLSNGVYLCSVKVNGKDYATKQLILMK